jgi:hypothetical protein
MPETHRSRTAVRFEVVQSPEGEPVIVLVLTPESETSPVPNRMFTLDLAPGMTPEEAAILAQALNRCVTHLGMANPGDEKGSQVPAQDEEASKPVAGQG